MRESKPTIYDPNFLPNMIYSGVPSWLNLSVIENDEDLKKIDAAVVGVPWEGGCTIGGYSSTTEGPKAVRSTSIRYTGFLPDYNLDCFDYLRVADSGDVATQNGNYDFTFQSIRLMPRSFPSPSAGTMGSLTPSSVKSPNGIPRRSGYCISMPTWITTPISGMTNCPAVLLSTGYTTIPIWILRRLPISGSGDPETIGKNTTTP